MSVSEDRPFTLVSGASSGIGRAIALRLSPRRALILHGRDAARLEAVRKDCADPPAHLIWPCDFRNASQVASALTDFMAGIPAGIEGLVHCAGIVHVLPARSAGLEAVMESLNVNYVAAQQIAATLLKKRVNRARLRNVLFISSIFSRAGARGHSLYCASKAALDGLMRALAVELAPEVRVNSILPGAIRTPMAETAMADPEIMARWQQDYPLGLGQGGDIASAVEFLLSDNARWITGQQLVVDGGRSVNLSLK